MTTENVLYQDQAIRITPTRVIVGKRTHLVADLKSAAVARVTGTSTASCLLVAVGLGVCGLAGYLASAASTMKVDGFPNADTQSIGVFLFIVLVIGLLLFATGAARIFLQKPHYAATVAVAAGQFSLLVSPKQDYIQRIVNALNEAIAKRG
jgi:hypothetical protein